MLANVRKSLFNLPAILKAWWIDATDFSTKPDAPSDDNIPQAALAFVMALAIITLIVLAMM
jgi:hypothetical protein